MSKTLKDLSTDSYSITLASEDKKKKLYLVLEVDSDGSAYVYYLVEKCGQFNPTRHFITLSAACRAYDEI